MQAKIKDMILLGKYNRINKILYVSYLILGDDILINIKLMTKKKRSNEKMGKNLFYY